MRRKRVWEIGATAALLLVVGVAAVNGYLWHRRQQELNASLAAELASPAVSTTSIRRLLDQGADIRTRGPFGENVLTAAALGDDLRLAAHALDSGVPLNVSDRGSTALHLAAENGRAGIVELLLARGATVDERDRDGATPLMCAASYCEPATIRVLLSAGANAALRDYSGATVFDYTRNTMATPWARMNTQWAEDGAETVRLLKDALMRKRTAANRDP